MLEYLQKYKNLPPEIRGSIGSKARTEELERLEEEYGISLASFVIRVAVKDIYFNNLAANIISEFGLSPKKALTLGSELKEKVFDGILGYLQKDPKPSSDILKKGGQKGKKIDLSHLYDKKDGASSKTKNESGSKKLDLSHLYSSDGPKQDKDKNDHISAGKERKEKGREEEIKKEEEKQPKKETAGSQKDLAVKKESSVARQKEKEGKTEDKQEREADISFEEDEKEAAEFSKKAQELKKKDKTASDINEKADKVAKEADLAFSSQQLSDRFKKMVITYLKGVRNRVDTKAALCRKPEEGGIGLDEDASSKVVKIAEKYKQEENKGAPAGKLNIKERNNGTAFIFNKETKEKEAVDIGARDADYDLASVLKSSGKLKSGQQEKDLGNIGSDSKKQESEKDKKQESEKDKKQESEKDKKGDNRSEKETKDEDKSGKSEPVSKPAPRSRPSAGKKRMDDIKPAPKSMGPIDELRYMDLSSFRRLSGSPEGRVGKVKEKIELISKQGIEKRLEAIDAWRNSPVNKTYLNIGKQSIGQGMGVDEIIKKMESEGREVLEKQEFNAVMDLNDELRF